MFLWLTPSGRSSISFTIGIIAVNFIVDGMVGIVVLAWKLLVAALCPADNLSSADTVKRRIRLSIQLMRICEGA